MATPNDPMTEGKLWQALNRWRHSPQYPTAVRALAGLYEGILTFMFFVGGGLLIAGRDALIGMMQDAGASLQASSSAGQGAVFLGIVALFFGAVHGWAALHLFLGASRYFYILVLNLAWLLLNVFVLRLASLEIWAQAIASLLIVVVFLFDNRLKAAYGRGPYAVAYWQRQETIRLGKPLSPDEEWT